MKTVTLKKISLKNFKAQKDLDVDFADKTVLSGKNKAGKSTVFASFIWLLFGKDQFDRKDYEIIPIENFKQLDKVDSEVSALIEVDGVSYNLKRVLHQNWVRPRGSAEEMYKGNETQYWVNGVPKKAGEYKLIVDGVIDETLFKLITNPAAFLALHWTKQREFLFDIAGTVSDAEIAASDSRFSDLLEMVGQKSLLEYKKEISARKRKLREALEDIQPKIDQTTKLTPEQKDWSSLEESIADINAQIKAIDEQIADRSKAIRAQYDEIQAKQGQVNELKSKQRELVNKEQTKAQNEAFESNKKRTDLENRVAELLRALKTTESQRDQAASALESLKKKKEAILSELETLRSKWTQENEKEYNGDSACLICPISGIACGDRSTLAKHEESREKAKEAFFDAKSKALDSINEEGKSKKEELNFIENRIHDGETYLTETSDKITQLNIEHRRMADELTVTPTVGPKTINPEEVTGYTEITEQIKAIEATMVDVKPVDNSDLIPKKAELTKEVDELKKLYSDKSLIERYKAEVVRLENEAKDLSQQIADIEKVEFNIDAFNKVKIDEVEKRVNQMFEIVRWKLFDKTNDGNEFEVCIATNENGVPISTTNTAEQINAGLDIIRTLSRFHNVSAPIFCDGSESVNDYLETGSQMVFLRVTLENSLTISNY